ncbi:hypothetical protein Cgig2_015469 [Carnegiea gigantea]|uniref:Uncharacterized protein n=1 Tax=Carnegiea gigantea TaxID=171969 RepID=A0A9Q1GLY8_9CARY|nr:hypothetical protein Cgig2_015469 [Carnegiea gigantea]
MLELKMKLLAKRTTNPTTRAKKFVPFDICDPSLQDITRQLRLAPIRLGHGSLSKRRASDALENFMSTMIGTIMQQVTEQVKKVMVAARFARPLPHLDYMPTVGWEPFHRHIPIASRHHSDEGREAAYPNRNADHEESTMISALGWTPYRSISRTRDDRQRQLQPQRYM